jgi:hypothetical protein
LCVNDEHAAGYENQTGRMGPSASIAEQFTFWAPGLNDQTIVSV